MERVGCPDQRTVVGTLEDIADLAERFEVKSPSTIVLGGAVNILLGEYYSGEYYVMVGEEDMDRGERGRRRSFAV